MLTAGKIHSAKGLSKFTPNLFGKEFPLFSRLWFEGEREQCNSAVTGGEIKGAASLPNDPRTASWTHSWVSWLVQTHVLCKNYHIRNNLKIKIHYITYSLLSLDIYRVGNRKKLWFWLKLSEFRGRRYNCRSRIIESAKLPSSMVYSMLDSIDR